MFVTDKQRQTIEEHGTPVPIVDGPTGDTYILLGVEFGSDPNQSGFNARMPGISAYGEGETQQEAWLAFCESLRGYLEVFAGG